MENLQKAGNNKILDLSAMSPDQTKRLNRLARDIRFQYAEFVDEICKRHSNEKLIWALPIISRNTAIDGSFLKLCRILLVLEEYSPDKYVGVSGLSRDEAECIFSNDPSIPIISPITENKSMIRAAKGRVGRVYRELIQFCQYIHRYFLNIKKNTKRRSFSNEIAIITPLISSSVREGKYFDRYFTDIQDYLTNPMTFLPMITFDDDKGCRELLVQLEKDDRYSFVFYEAYGRLTDLLELYRYHKLCKKLAKEHYCFGEIDITSIISESLKEGIGCTATYRGLLFTKYLERLSKQKQIINNFVVWYEGRPTDLYVVSSIRRLFPKASCIAYELYPFDNLSLSQFFTDYEVATNHAPTKVLVPAGGFINDFHEYSPEICVKEAPILRNRYELACDDLEENNGDSIRILLVLPVFVDKCRTIILALNSYLMDLDGMSRYSVKIKNHPIMNGYSAEDYFGREVCFRAEYLDGPLDECLKEADVIITSSTSSSLEVLYGCKPLIIVCGQGELLYTGLPNNEELSKLYYVVYGQEEFNSIMSDLRQTHMDYHCLESLLLPVNKETVREIIEV